MVIHVVTTLDKGLEKLGLYTMAGENRCLLKFRGKGRRIEQMVPLSHDSMIVLMRPYA